MNEVEYRIFLILLEEIQWQKQLDFANFKIRLDFSRKKNILFSQSLSPEAVSVDCNKYYVIVKPTL